MNRVLKIIIYAVLLFLLYIWISSVARSCNKEDNTNEMAAAESAEEFSADDEIYDEYFEKDENASSGEDAFSDDYEYDDVPEEDQYVEAVETTGNEDDFSYESEPIEATPPPARTSSTPSSSSSSNYSSSSSSGKYMIIAGSYLIRENAEKMVNRLKNLGYNGAEIVTFDLSQYHTVSAGRYSSYGDAGNIAGQIKNKGIDCYVHTRK